MKGSVGDACIKKESTYVKGTIKARSFSTRVGMEWYSSYPLQLN